MALALFLLALAGPAVHAAQKVRPISAGGSVFNPADVVAVYRPVEHGPVAVYVGRPGQGIHTILVRDVREATAVFNDVWHNKDATRDPGDEDPRPLTRMLARGSEGKVPILVANADRISAIVFDAERRTVRVYFDRPTLSGPLIDPGGEEREFLDLPNSRGEADAVAAAYKQCVCNR